MENEMKLFNERKDQKEYFLYTEKALKIDNQIHKIIRPMFEECKTQQEVRDMTHLICSLGYSESARRSLEITCDNSKLKGK